MREPWPLAMNGGVPPTPRKARTGELTPPGISFCARAKRLSDLRVVLANVFTGDEFVEEEVHHKLRNCAIQVLQQPALQTQIRLGSRKQILHQVAESRTAADKLDHPRRYRAEQERAQEQ